MCFDQLIDPVTDRLIHVDELKAINQGINQWRFYRNVTCAVFRRVCPAEWRSHRQLEAAGEIGVHCSDISDTCLRSRQRVFTAHQHRPTKHPVCSRLDIFLIYYFESKNARFYFFNHSVKNHPILIVFDVQHREEA